MLLDHQIRLGKWLIMCQHQLLGKMPISLVPIRILSSKLKNAKMQKCNLLQMSQSPKTNSLTQVPRPNNPLQPKELEIIQPNGFGSDRENENDEDGEVEERVTVKRKMKVDGESEHNGRQQRHEKDGSIHFSVMKIIEADEKRSDLEYDISQKEINLEKLQIIANTGLPDGGCLRATVWKLLLGYLPPSGDLWDKELTENRQKYAKLKEELPLTPSELARIKEALHSNEHNNAVSD
ncbi:hypothetical protein CRYUN_Cryun02cG0081700 [Craigia yunnanensis]